MMFSICLIRGEKISDKCDWTSLGFYDFAESYRCHKIQYEPSPNCQNPLNIIYFDRYAGRILCIFGTFSSTFSNWISGQRKTNYGRNKDISLIKIQKGQEQCFFSAVEFIFCWLNHQ